MILKLEENVPIIYINYSILLVDTLNISLEILQIYMWDLTMQYEFSV